MRQFAFNGSYGNTNHILDITKRGIVMTVEIPPTRVGMLGHRRLRQHPAVNDPGTDSRHEQFRQRDLRRARRFRLQRTLRPHLLPPAVFIQPVRRFGVHEPASAATVT